MVQLGALSLREVLWGETATWPHKPAFKWQVPCQVLRRRGLESFWSSISQGVSDYLFEAGGCGDSRCSYGHDSWTTPVLRCVRE